MIEFLFLVQRKENRPRCTEDLILDKSRESSNNWIYEYAIYLMLILSRGLRDIIFSKLTDCELIFDLAPSQKPVKLLHALQLKFLSLTKPLFIKFNVWKRFVLFRKISDVITV